MLKVFFRYVFGIPPLMLVLLPVGSLACEKKNMAGIMKSYENVLFHRLEIVKKYEFRNETCCKKEESEELRKYLCNETMEIISLFRMGCALRKLAVGIRKNSYIRCSITRLSYETEDVLACKCKNKVKNCEPRHGTTQISVDRCNQKICALKKLIPSFKSCWDQLMQSGQR